MLHYLIIGAILIATHGAAGALGMAYKAKALAAKDALKKAAEDKLGKL